MEELAAPSKRSGFNRFPLEGGSRLEVAHLVGIFLRVGREAREEIMRVLARIDRKGRVLLPRKIREEAKVGAGDIVAIYVEGGKICLQPLRSAADEFYGAFKVEKWPDDLDEFFIEAMKRWWKGQST